MTKKIRIGICGYGNLGHGVELAVNRAEDMELVGIFSRRDLPGTASGVPAINLKHVLEYKDKIDVMVLCGGSATDLIDQGPELAQHFVTVDSFDTHPRIPEHFANMEAVTKANNTASIISVGWDPGLFSLLRVLGDSVLPEGKSYTFWGKGVSQGHSDAIRRIPGVKNGKQYTIPKEEYLEAVRSGKGTDAPGNEMHLRECFVVPEEGADLKAIETAIKTMPNYFVGYETTVHFISEEDREKPQRHPPRRLCVPQRENRRYHRPCDGILPEAGQQPAVHLQRADRLCPGHVPPAFRAGKMRRFHRAGHPVCDAFPQIPRRFAEIYAVIHCNSC